MRETTNRFVSKHLATVLQRNFLNLKNDSKKIFILPLFIFTMLFAQQSYAALTVTVSYTGSAPTGGTLISGSPFSTLSAAITQLCESLLQQPKIAHLVFSRRTNQKQKTKRAIFPNANKMRKTVI